MHRLPRRSALLGSAALACMIGLSSLVAPAAMPQDLGGSVARAELFIEFSVFEDALSPYGRWVDSPRYGLVWHPVGLRRDWRPYYDDGYWAYSDDDGWVWVSDLPWGWAPFHYGRWAQDIDYGWIWVPGRVWSPAWVTFRWTDDAIGWAPIPPEVEWDPGYGYRESNLVISIDFWSFVRPEGFTARRFDNYAYDRRQYQTIINRTTNITNITVINNRVVNRGIDLSDVERVSRRKVDRVRLSDSDRPERARHDGRDVSLYKPVVRESGGDTSDAALSVVKENPVEDNKRRADRRSRRGDNGSGRDQPAAAADDGNPVVREKESSRNTEGQGEAEPVRETDQAVSPSVMPEDVEPSAGRTQRSKGKRDKGENTSDTDAEREIPSRVQNDTKPPDVGMLKPEEPLLELEQGQSPAEMSRGEEATKRAERRREQREIARDKRRSSGDDIRPAIQDEEAADPEATAPTRRRAERETTRAPKAEAEPKPINRDPPAAEPNNPPPEIIEPAAGNERRDRSRLEVNTEDKPQARRGGSGRQKRHSNDGEQAGEID